MDFLKKAKAKVAELENDLNKATASLGLGGKEEAGSGPAAQASASVGAAPDTSSSFSTPATSTANTPSTSVAPSSAPDAPKTKLPMAVRKDVRDNWEAKIPELEANLSSTMGVPWKISVDPGYIYSFAEDRYAKESTGQMLTEYVTDANEGIRGYLDKFGADGRSELNVLCSSHILTLEPATNPKISICGCEIRDGCLRIVFNNKYLGYNIGTTTENLADVVNAAGVAASTSNGSGAALDFHAKQSIKKDYEPAIGAIQSRIAGALAAPVITLQSNFEHNFAKLAAYTATGTQSPMFPREWQKHIGESAIAYFEAFAENLEDGGFGKDEMLQEGFKEMVEKNEIGLRVVDKLSEKGGRRYNESVIEGGVFYMQMTPEYWITNIGDASKGIIDLL